MKRGQPTNKLQRRGLEQRPRPHEEEGKLMVSRAERESWQRQLSEATENDVREAIASGEFSGPKDDDWECDWNPGAGE